MVKTQIIVFQICSLEKYIFLSESVKSFNSYISVIVCSFFEFGIVSKWCTREWVKVSLPEIKIFNLSKCESNADKKLNPLSNKKSNFLGILKLVITDLAVFAEDNLDVTPTVKMCSGKRIEKIVGKGENAVHQQFLLCHNVSKSSYAC